jgi:hypothetical protein
MAGSAFFVKWRDEDGTWDFSESATMFPEVHTATQLSKRQKI